MVFAGLSHGLGGSGGTMLTIAGGILIAIAALVGVVLLVVFWRVAIRLVSVVFLVAIVWMNFQDKPKQQEITAAIGDVWKTITEKAGF
jgi:fatty acid desaturase